MIREHVHLATELLAIVLRSLFGFLCAREVSRLNGACDPWWPLSAYPAIFLFKFTYMPLQGNTESLDMFRRHRIHDIGGARKNLKDEKLLVMAHIDVVAELLRCLMWIHRGRS